MHTYIYDATQAGTYKIRYHTRAWSLTNQKNTAVLSQTYNGFTENNFAKATAIITCDTKYHKTNK